MRRSCVAALLMAAVAVPVGAVPLETFGRLPSAQHVVISPDGSEIALVVSNAQAHQIRINKTADLSPVAFAPAGDHEIAGLQWVGPHHLMVIYSYTSAPLGYVDRGKFYLATDIDLRSGKSTELLDSTRSQAIVNALYGWPESGVIGGRPTVFLKTLGSNDHLAMIRQELEVHSSLSNSILSDPDTTDMTITSSGNMLARALYNRDTENWSLWTRRPNAVDWLPQPHTLAGWTRVHREKVPIDLPDVAGIREGGKALIVETDENGVSRFHEQPLAGGDWGPAIAALDNAALIRDPVSHEVIGGATEEMTDVRYSFLDPKDQRVWDAVTRAFPGETVWLSSWSDDRSKVILRVEGPKSGAAYYLLDTRTHRADWITDEYRGVTAQDLAPVTAIHYPAGDGLDIPAYLTLPRALPAKNLPLVVLVHGGPEARDDPGFDWWSQALASLGYAVLRPQFRGSWGFAPGFVTAGYGQWGRKMQTDLSDGVAWLAKNGTIDPARVCIVGASYGGYAAMAGVTLQSGIYRCAVAVAGISDLKRQIGQIAIDHGGPNIPAYRYYLRFTGAKDGGDPLLDALSPVRHADKLSAPLLLIHGTLDTVVLPVQSRIMQEAAAKAGKTVQLVMLPGEDHNLGHGATRLQMLQAIADFLKAHLPTAGAVQQQAAR